MTSAQPARKLERQAPLQGLCTTCMHSEGCMYSKNEPVVFCEEFEITSAPSLRIVTERKEHEPSALLGLCSNCANSESCSFPRPETGVWHCEEYR